MFESFLKNSCEASYMGRCYWSGRCKEPKLFQSLFEETIAGLAAVRAVEKFKESGEICIRRLMVLNFGCIDADLFYRQESPRPAV